MRYLRHIFLFFFIVAVTSVSPITTKAALTDGSTDAATGNSSQGNDAAGSTGGGNSNAAYPVFNSSSSVMSSITSSPSDMQAAQSQNAKLANDRRSKCSGVG